MNRLVSEDRRLAADGAAQVELVAEGTEPTMLPSRLHQHAQVSAGCSTTSPAVTDARATAQPAHCTSRAHAEQLTPLPSWTLAWPAECPGALAVVESVWGSLAELELLRRDGVAVEAVNEALDTAGRLAMDSNHRFTAFSPTSVGLYQISIARVLGDSGAAIDAARRINPSAIPLAERRARYWSDVARSFHQWGKPEQCFQALLAAEHASPDEVRYRKPVQQITTSLLRHPSAHTMPRPAGIRSPHRNLPLRGSLARRETPIHMRKS